MGELLHPGIGQMIQGEALACGVLGHFKAVQGQDSTSLSLVASWREIWGGCNKTGTGSAGLKIRGDWDLVSGGLSGLELSAAKAHDQHAALAQAAVAAGSLPGRVRRAVIS